MLNILIIALAAGSVWSNPVQRPVTCNGYTCNLNGQEIDCRDHGYECCSGPSIEGWSAVPATRGFRCCPGSGELFSEARSACVNGTIRAKLPNEIQCGWTAVYDPESQECCKSPDQSIGHVYPKEPQGQCCHTRYLTDPEYGCCEGTVYPRAEMTCCPSPQGHRLYSIPNGQCCLQTAYDPDGPMECNPRRGLVNKSERSFKVRCSERPYDPEVHICCYDALYNRSDYLCYNGKTAVLKGRPRDNQVCIRRTNGHISRSNLTSYLTFYNGTGHLRACINGQIRRLEAHQGICESAANGIYDKNVDLCCGDMEFHRYGRRDGKRCCAGGTNAYNPATQTCCRNVVEDVSEDEGGRCCNRRAYSRKTHECKNGGLVPAVCPDPSKPPFVDRCNLTAEHLSKLQATFHGSGMLVYAGTVIGDPQVKKRQRKWRVGDVEQFAALAGKKRRKSPGKFKLDPVRGEISLKVKECRCPYELVPGERYLFITAKPLKRKVLSPTVLELTESKATDAIIPLSEAEKLGSWFQVMFGNDS